MKKKTLSLFLAALLFAACSDKQGFTVERSRILIDSRYDGTNAAAEEFIAPYRHVVDSIMSPVVGSVAEYMYAKRPESNLSNLLTDVLMWAAESYGEKPDFAVYNMGGMRAALSAGSVTYGNVLDVAPFENKICFFDLAGSDVDELFRQIARNRGEGVSHGVKLVISKQGEVVSLTLNGQPIDPARTYRVCSIDYLAEGNDGLTAFKAKKNANLPKDESNNLRFIIMDYFRHDAAQGRVTNAKVEGRITIEE